MLTVTDTAVEAIREILASEPDLPAEAGLRIAAHQHGDHFHLGIDLVDGPEDGDAVFEAEGARVFVEDVLLDELDGVALHAEEDDEGISFTFVDADGSPLDDGHDH